MNGYPLRLLWVAASVFLVTGTVVAQDEDQCPEPGVSIPDTSETCGQDLTGETLVTVKICNEDLDLPTLFGFIRNQCNGSLAVEGTTGRKLVTPNLRVAAFLSRLDIDGDGVPDNAPDTDGDGLPDNWEIGGFEALTAGGEALDRAVFYPAPSAIVPGTPPTPIFTRLAVATSALNPDTDGDGLSDFVEVFGLMFIDENRNGILDANEWADLNGDGLPSPGEYPLDNSGFSFSRENGTRVELLHDFDGFVFTDPTNPDTDGDGILDGEDNDPLINPRAFGNVGQIIVRFSATENDDIDKDGLGNGMDLGNDLVSTDELVGTLPDFQVIDNPQNITDLLQLFRPDLLGEEVVPEAQIEDLLGADWDGNGLWRTTDIRDWSLITDFELSPPDTALEFRLEPGIEFRLDQNDPGSHRFFAPQTFADIQAVLDDPNYSAYGSSPAAPGIGMGWQQVLKPSGPAGATQFIPDVRVWAILYSWRVPGFDIDGDGFVGAPNVSSTVVARVDADGEPIASVALRADRTTGELKLSSEVVISTAEQNNDRPFDDRISLVAADLAEIEDPELTIDGIVQAPKGFPALPCGNVGGMIFAAMLLGLAGLRLVRRR